MIIEFEIFHHSDSSATLKQLDIDYSLDQCDIRPITFLNINAISPYIDNEKEYCSIHSNGSEYICKMPYRVVKRLLEKELQLKHDISKPII